MEKPIHRQRAIFNKITIERYSEKIIEHQIKGEKQIKGYFHGCAAFDGKV